MRLYNYKNILKGIDVTCVTDGSGAQRKIFITESLRGVTPRGNLNKPGEGGSFIELGWPWCVGESVDHEDLIKFALKKDLQLIVSSESESKIVGISPIWKEPTNLELTFEEIVKKEKVRLRFLKANLESIKFGVSAALKGKLISPDVLEVEVENEKPFELTAEDLSLGSKEELFVEVLDKFNLEQFVLKTFDKAE